MIHQTQQYNENMTKNKKKKKKKKKERKRSEQPPQGHTKNKQYKNHRLRTVSS